MNNCRDCFERSYPTDPSVGLVLWEHKTVTGLDGKPRSVRTQGKYLKSQCELCRDSINGKPKQSVEMISARITFLEELETYDPPWLYEQWQIVVQLKGQVLYLQKKVKELAAVKKNDEHY